MSKNWELEGMYFEACNCVGACPCLFGGDPTEGDCKALVGWHVERGRFGDVELDGLNMAMGVHSPGNLTEGNWKVVVYVDGNASDAQRDALMKIFGGEAGGHPAMLASLVGEILAVESVPMQYDITARRHSLKVGEVAAASLEAIEGQGGDDVRITGHPVAIAPEQNLVVAKTERVSHSGHGLDWELNDTTAAFSPFRYEAA